MDSQHSTDAEEKPTAETDRSETLRDILDGSIDTKLRLIQHHAKMARLLAEEVLDEEVESLAGERYSRKEDGNPFRRWGSNAGSIRIDGEKVPIDVPRVRDTDTEEERSLKSYQAMKSAEVGPEMVKAILLGLSQGNYQQVASQFVDGFGLSQSSVSRQFQERAQQALEEFENRSLEEENFLALWIDGKRVAGQQMIVCMGVTEEGYKKVLGFAQATTELRSSAVSGTSGKMLSATFRRQTRKPGDPGFSKPTRSRPTRPPNSGSPISTPIWSRSIGGRRAPFRRG